MKKKEGKKKVWKRAVVLFLLVGYLIQVLIYSSFSAEPGTIVVIDQPVNTSLFKDNIVTEACFVKLIPCPNKQMSMEGPGAATLPATVNVASASHGTQMVSIILSVNPSARIIPITVYALSNKGNPGVASLEEIKAALNWVIQNRVKYNITVVSISQGKLLPKCDVPAGMAEQIAALKAVDVPVIAATGNDGNRTAVYGPACISDVVSVGATDNPDPGTKKLAYDKLAKPYIARYSNGWATTDFYLNGRWYVKNADGTTKFIVGTSNATASLAGLWSLNPGTFDATYSKFAIGSTEAKNEWLTGRYVLIP
jgi:hypothetical protein